MAVHALTADRRGILSSITLAGLAGAVPTVAKALPPVAPGRDLWDVALARYVSAQHAMATQQGEEIVRRFIDAEQAVLATRAPDIQALRWKVECIRDISEHSVLESEDFDCLLADLRALGNA